MALKNRYDFVMLFDVENGNPNGDPDFANAPRMDAESGYGYVTDVCLKRKVRNYVELVKGGQQGYNILIKMDKSLNEKFAEAYTLEEAKVADKSNKDEIYKNARDYMCKNYFDVRAFGAVMSTGDNPLGILRGPVQFTFARSVSPITVQDISITRQAVTKPEDFSKKDNEMGRKSFVPYALYRGEGFVSAALNNKLTNGLNEDDLELLWQSIINMFENDHSAARGKMVMRKLYLFKHDNVLGACPSQILFDKIQVKEKIQEVPRNFSDYEITIDRNMPVGVELIEKL